MGCSKKLFEGLFGASQIRVMYERLESNFYTNNDLVRNCENARKYIKFGRSMCEIYDNLCLIADIIDQNCDSLDSDSSLRLKIFRTSVLY